MSLREQTIPQESILNPQAEVLNLGYKPVVVDLNATLEPGYRVNMHGKLRDVDVIAKITQPDTKEEVLLFSAHDEKIGDYQAVALARTYYEGEPPEVTGQVITNKLDSKRRKAQLFELPVKLGKGTATLSMLSSDKDHASFTYSGGLKEQPQIIISQRSAEQVPFTKKIRAAREEVYRTGHKVGRIISRVALGALALTTPHGPADQIIDAIQDPKTVVEGAAHDYAEMAQNSDKYAEISSNIHVATANVESIVDDFDNGNTVAIKQRAVEFRATHADELVSDEALNAYNEAVVHAKDDAEVVGLLNNFLYENGYSVHVGMTGIINNADLTKITPSKLAKGPRREIITEYAQEIAKTISLFPPSMFNTYFDLGNIYLSDGIVSEKQAAGVYVPGPGYISLSTGDDFIENSSRPGNTFEHELVHASMYNTGVETPVETTPLKYPKMFADSLLAHSDYTSYYGASEAEENRAEIGAELLTEGIAEPDAGLAYNQPYNKKIIEMLVEYDYVYPGIADHLISKIMLEPNPNYTYNMLADNDPEPKHGEDYRRMLGLIFLGVLNKSRKPRIDIVKGKTVTL